MFSLDFKPSELSIVISFPANSSFSLLFFKTVFMLPVFSSTVSIPFITSLCKFDIIFTFFIWILLLYISPFSLFNSIIPNDSYPFVFTVPLKNVFSIFLSSSFLYMYFPIISYSVSASSPVTIISPDCVYVLLKYIFPSLYISKR